MLDFLPTLLAQAAPEPTVIVAAPNTTWPQVVMTLLSVVAALLAFIQSMRNSGKIADVRYQINGRIDETLRLNRALAHAQGLAEGKDSWRPTPPAPADLDRGQAQAAPAPGKDPFQP